MWILDALPVITRKSETPFHWNNWLYFEKWCCFNVSVYQFFFDTGPNRWNAMQV